MNSICRSIFFLAWGLILFPGCGKQATDPALSSQGLDGTTRGQSAEMVPIVPPTASINVPVIPSDTPAKQLGEPAKTAMADVKPTTPIQESRSNRPEKGSLEAIVQEIASLKQAADRPLQADQQPKSGTQSEDVSVHRHKKIIELAQQVIVKSHENPEQVAFLNSAVQDLADARLQLAIAGDAAQAQLLSEDAAVLYRKDPSSFAAAEAAFKLVQYTQVRAQSQAAKNPKWALGYARQARLFASQFPQETNRAAIHLVAAGRICDKVGLTNEAKNCLIVIEQKFPNSPFADQVKNSLRRLRLPGQELLEFGGSTLDGNYLSIDQFKGRPVIIAFWASNSVVFQEDMKLINDVVQSFGGSTAVIGVNLDLEESAVDRFIQTTGNRWPHIFYSDVKKRGMDNLVAKYYGVSKVPSYWLLDAQGIVKTVSLKPQELRQQLAQISMGGK